MQRTRELVSENLRAIRKLPESERLVAIDRLASILEGEDDDQVDDDLLVFGRVVRDRVGRVLGDDELKRHFEAKFGAIKWS